MNPILTNVFADVGYSGPTFERTTSTANKVGRPNWMVSRDCTVYDIKCFVQNEFRYQPYPFDGSRSDYEYSDLSDLPLPIPTKQHVDRQTIIPTSNPNDPCLQYGNETPYEQQLDEIMKKLSRVQGWVAYTISDINYANDMIHDVFEMAHHIVGFPNAFFMVAMDQSTMELACQYGYPVIPSPISGDLESRVKLTKFQISFDLLNRHQNFLFFEMDVWFTKPILPLLEKQWGDIMVSAHQNIIHMNIGVYSAKANAATLEYFQQCIQVGSKTSIHDQELMHLLYMLHHSVHQNTPRAIPKAARLLNVTVVHPVQVELIGAHEIVAASHIWPTGSSIAIHVLCGRPLTYPHGKKQMAKELGVYYGSHGYYDANQRYLWLDNGMGNAYSLLQTSLNHTESGMFEHIRPWKWAMATMVYLAKTTDRIWLVPTAHWLQGPYFLWTFLDFKSVENIIGDHYREAGFLSNPKVGAFASVSRTALGLHQLFWEDSQRGTKVWDLRNSDRPVEMLVSLVKGIDSKALIVNTDFVNHDWELRARAKLQRKPNNMVSSMSPAELEIVKIYKQLKWCHSEKCNNPNRPCAWDILNKHTKPLILETADGNCYGKGSIAL